MTSWQNKPRLLPSFLPDTSVWKTQTSSMCREVMHPAGFSTPNLSLENGQHSVSFLLF